MPTRRIAVLGAGPIGLEAALAFREIGHDVQVYERSTVAGNLKRWGHVRLFSPFEINHSERGSRLLEGQGARLPDKGDYLTAAEHVERYLEPLAGSALLRGRIHQATEVVAVGRDGIGKNELIGGPRDQHPFRLFLQRDTGEEDVVEADAVIDCTGTYGNANWMGNGNLPAKGERGLRERIDCELRDLTGADRERYEGKSVLVVGGGHSAATALDDLRQLRDTTVHWVARKQDPLEIILKDPLPERKRLSERANALSRGVEPGVRFYAGASVESIRESTYGLEVELRRNGASERIVVDRILAHVGYRPDNTIYRELQVHECYASLAPMKLAAALLGDSSADCLTQTSKGAETLVNPEPDFFILGAKSYGKNSNFLIRTGLEQVEEILGLMVSGRRKERVS